MVPGVGIKGVRIISGSLKKTNIREQVENAEAWMELSLSGQGDRRKSSGQSGRQVQDGRSGHQWYMQRSVHQCKV